MVVLGGRFGDYIRSVDSCSDRVIDNISGSEVVFALYTICA